MCLFRAVQRDSDQHTPRVGQRQQAQQALHDHVERYFQLEALALQYSKETFKQESPAISRPDRRHRAGVTDEDQRLTILGVRQDHVHRLLVDQHVLDQQTGTAALQATQPVLRRPVVRECVAPQAHADGNLTGGQSLNPVIADEFAIGVQDPNVRCTEQAG